MPDTVTPPPRPDSFNWLEVTTASASACRHEHVSGMGRCCNARLPHPAVHAKQAAEHGDLFGKFISVAGDLGGDERPPPPEGKKAASGNVHDSAAAFFPDTPAGAAGADVYIEGYNAMPSDPINPRTVKLQGEVRRACMLLGAAQHACVIIMLAGMHNMLCDSVIELSNSLHAAKHKLNAQELHQFAIRQASFTCNRIGEKGCVQGWCSMCIGVPKSRMHNMHAGAV